MPRAVDGLIGRGGPGAHVDAYMQYRELVGDLDEGRLLQEADYEALVRRAADPSRRLYVNYRNVRTGLDCKAIGPSSQCFCGHRYREHAWDAFESRQLRCKMRGCRCSCFSYVPVKGSQLFRCSKCKEPNTSHDCATRKCPRSSDTFRASTLCTCNDTYPDHETVFESLAERERDGRATDSAWMKQAAAQGLPVCHLGGIIGMQSLADGIDRAQAGLEPGFEHMYTGLDPNGFVANMAMRDDVASASVVGGRAAGHRALAKYRTETGSVRPNERAIAEGRRQPPVPPGPRQLTNRPTSSGSSGGRGTARSASPSLGRAGGAIVSAPGAARPPARIHTLQDARSRPPGSPGVRTQSPGASRARSPTSAVPSGGRVLGSGPSGPMRGAAASSQAARAVPARPRSPVASAAKAKAKPKASPKASAGAPRVAGSAVPGGGHRLGGAKARDPEAMREARLRALDQ